MEAWPQVGNQKTGGFWNQQFLGLEGRTLVQVNRYCLVQCYNYVSGYCKSSDGSSAD